MNRHKGARCDAEPGLTLIQVYVFSEWLKQSSEMDGSRSSDDKAFQAAGPDVENARGPNVDVSVLGTTN